MQFDVVEMLHCHSELLGASSLPESLIVKLDGEGKDRGGAGSGTHLNEASLAQTRGVEQICCCPIVVHVIIIPCPCHQHCHSIVVMCISEAGWKGVCLLWYFKVKNNEEQ